MDKQLTNGPQISAAHMRQAKDIRCENCGNYTFEEVILMKRISSILSPTGKEAIVPIPVFGCNACGSVNPEFLPPFMIPEDENMQPEEIPATDTAEPTKSSILLVP